MPVSKTIQDGVAVITFDHPPVNGFGFDVRRGVVEALNASIEDAAIKAIVITAGGTMFSGGADITEFNTPRAERAPSLHDVIAAIEASSKPVVMAINGTALGGGLEVAMAAHYRIAAKGALLGLPEVKIGILPGGGGTQRLPRAVGLEAAINMIVSGEPVPAEHLGGTRLLDEVVDGDVVAAAVTFAKRVVGNGELPLLRKLKVEHENAEGFLDFARNSVAAVAGPFPAPMKCLEAIEASFQKSFDDGMAVERAGFISLVTSTESKALRHAFFGERAASKIADVGKGASARLGGRVEGADQRRLDHREVRPDDGVRRGSDGRRRGAHRSRSERRRRRGRCRNRRRRVDHLLPGLLDAKTQAVTLVLKFRELVLFDEAQDFFDVVQIHRSQTVRRSRGALVSTSRP